MQLPLERILVNLSRLLMREGKRKQALAKVLGSFQTFQSQAKPLKNLCLLTTVLHQSKPLLETRKVRRGAKYFDVPFFLTRKRSYSLLLRWLAAVLRRGHSSLELSKEFRALLAGQGATLQEAKALRQRVAANLIYAHYRWR